MDGCRMDVCVPNGTRIHTDCAELRQQLPVHRVARECGSREGVVPNPKLSEAHVVTRMVARLCGMNRLIAQSVPVPVRPARTALLGMIAAVPVLVQLASPAVSLAQTQSGDAIRWRGTVKYREVASSPDGHRVKNIETRFELLTPLLSPTDFEEGYVWQNVAIAYADSGRWHYDEHEVDGGTMPAVDLQWNTSDTLTVPASRTELLTSGELNAKREGGSVHEVQLPALPVRRVGSKVLVQPSEVRLLLEATYGRGMNASYPKRGDSDRLDLQVRILGRQPPHVPGEGVNVDEQSSEDYAGLPPEVVASLKMMDALSGNPGGDLDDDQIAIVQLKMAGFVDFDGNAVTGSRSWTSSAAEPGEYTSSIQDDQTSVSHQLVWEFVPIKGN